MEGTGWKSRERYRITISIFVKAGDLDSVTAALKYVDVNVRGRYSKTPLHFAAEVSIIKLH